jgi:hypothetical protein
MRNQYDILYIQWNLSNLTDTGTRKMCLIVQDVGILSDDEKKMSEKEKNGRLKEGTRGIFMLIRYSSVDELVCTDIWSIKLQKFL